MDRMLKALKKIGHTPVLYTHQKKHLWTSPAMKKLIQEAEARKLAENRPNKARSKEIQK